jgi:hypothetical protein
MCCHIADADAYRRITGVVGVEIKPNGVADSIERTISENSHKVMGVRLQFREIPALRELRFGFGQHSVFIEYASEAVVLAAVPCDEC